VPKPDHAGLIDPADAALYIGHMSTDKQTRKEELDLKKLEFQVDELISTCERLKSENRSLRGQHDTLVTERANLIKKTEMARQRVDAMITRLKSMEQGA
jgi:cell division protein ZapB